MTLPPNPGSGEAKQPSQLRADVPELRRIAERLDRVDLCYSRRVIMIAAAELERLRAATNEAALAKQIALQGAEILRLKQLLQAKGSEEDVVKCREAFEAWITSAPYERDVSRWPIDATKHAWPGQYKEYAVQLAWESWQAATARVKENDA